jgi:predicted nucleic-acid-binding Zn-ribbon protein
MNRQTFKVFSTAVAVVGLTVACGLGFSTHPSHAQTEDGKQSEAEVSSCPKCKGAMVQGIVRDYFDNNSFEQTAWSPGHPKQHIFSQGTRIKITVYRCSNCGFLESYAK